MHVATPRRRTSYHHGDLKRALLQAARVQVAAAGPETFTLREAARRAGVNHRAVYRHFADRESLLAAVALDGYRELLDRARDAMDGVRSGQARLIAFGRAYITFALEQPGAFRTMFGPRLNEEGRFPDLEAPAIEAFALLEKELTHLGERGARDGAIALWSMAHGLASLMLTRRVRVPPEKIGKYVERLLKMALEKG